MKTALGFLFILLTSSISANDLLIVEPSNDAFDLFLDDDVNYQNVDDLSEVLNTDKQKYKKYTPKEFVRETPTTPKILFAILLKESQLYKLNENKKIKNKKEIYVNAREVFYGGKWSYVYNKNKEVKYKTLTKNLAFIEEVIKIRSTIPGNEVYPKKSQFHTVDKTIPLEMHFLYRSESTNFKSLNILATNELDLARSNSISFKTYFNSLLPLDLGMVFDYQSGIVENDYESITWNSFSIGPTIKYDFYKYGDFIFNTQFAVKKSLFFNANAEMASVQLSTLAWQVGIEVAYHTRFGNFSLGLENSYIKTSIDGELQNQESFSNKKESLNQTAITMGYQYTWML